MKKIWKMLILCMILCFFCAGCNNDDEVISEDHPKPTTEKRTEIIKQKTTQTKNEATVDQEESKQQEDRNRCRTSKETDECKRSDRTWF